MVNRKHFDFRKPVLRGVLDLRRRGSPQTADPLLHIFQGIEKMSDRIRKTFLHSHIHWTHPFHCKSIVRALLEIIRYTGVNTVKSPFARSGRGPLRNSVWRNRSGRGVVEGYDVSRNLVNVSANVKLFSIMGV